MVDGLLGSQLRRRYSCGRRLLSCEIDGWALSGRSSRWLAMCVARGHALWPVGSVRSCSGGLLRAWRHRLQDGAKIACVTSFAAGTWMVFLVVWRLVCSADSVVFVILLRLAYTLPC